MLWSEAAIRHTELTQNYFRNALVRSCNSAYGANTEPTNYFLNRFFMNLLNNSDNVLDDLDLFINNSAE